MYAIEEENMDSRKPQRAKGEVNTLLTDWAAETCLTSTRVFDFMAATIPGSQYCRCGRCQGGRHRVNATPHPLHPSRSHLHAL